MEVEFKIIVTNYNKTEDHSHYQKIHYVTLFNHTFTVDQREETHTLHTGGRIPSSSQILVQAPGKGTFYPKREAEFTPKIDLNDLKSTNTLTLRMKWVNRPKEVGEQKYYELTYCLGRVELGETEVKLGDAVFHKA